MESLRLDLLFAFRSLRRRRTFAAVAILTVALSIGAGTSIYGVVDGVLFRSLPYHDAGTLVAVWQTIPDWRKEPILAPQWDHVRVSYPDFIQWRAKQTSFNAVGAWAGRTMILAGERPEQVSGTRASPSLFDALGVKAVIGRTFLPGEDILNGPHVTLVSYDAWQTRFGGRHDILGQTVLFDSIPYQIVGVLPKDFALVRGVAPTPFFTPAGQDSNDISAGNHSYRAIGRLRPGVSFERAGAEANQLLGGPDERPVRGIHLAEYQLDQTRDVRGPLFLLLGAVGLLVLVACLNVATLLLGEATAREPEMAARVALGATRARLVRQLLTESVLISVAGTAVGVALAWWMTKGLIAMAPAKIPGISAMLIDGRVLAVTAAAAAITGVLFGLVPALTLSRTGPASVLRLGLQSRAGRGRLQRIMVASELAISVVLLVGSGLVSRSLEKLAAVSPGFRPDHLVLVRMSLPRSQFRDPSRFTRYTNLLDRLGALPGVRGATGGGAVPFDGSYTSSTLRKENEVRTNAPGREVQQREIVPNFFATLGIPVLAGRPFAGTDGAGAPLVAIVSEALARRDWPNESPIGQRVLFQGSLRTVVGIVGDTKVNTLAAADLATIYTPFLQRWTTLTLVVRTAGDPVAMIPQIRNAVRDAAPDMPVTLAEPMESRIRMSYSDDRFRTILIDLFGIMAAVLAAVGMYGVTYRAVGQRKREMSIRVALGATATSVIQLMVGGTLRGVAIGVALGLGVSLAAAPLLAPYLFGVSTYDPATYGAIVLLLSAVSVVASVVPARRAGRVAPAAVLRGE